MNDEPSIVVACDCGIQIRSSRDISDALSMSLGRKGLLLTERDFSDDFFNLKTGLAGELFQKLVNYKIRTAVVIAKPEAYGERFKELAHEHSSHNLVRFFSSKDDAVVWLMSEGDGKAKVEGGQES
jgi:uncharacterized protein DUF4180